MRPLTHTANGDFTADLPRTAPFVWWEPRGFLHTLRNGYVWPCLCHTEESWPLVKTTSPMEEQCLHDSHLVAGQSLACLFSGKIVFILSEAQKHLDKTKQKQSTELKPHNTNHIKSLACEAGFHSITNSIFWLAFSSSYTFQVRLLNFGPSENWISWALLLVLNFECLGCSSVLILCWAQDGITINQKSDRWKRKKLKVFKLPKL